MKNLPSDLTREQALDLLDRISDGFYALDNDWHLTYVNRVAEQAWGRPREDLIGKNIWEVFPDAVGTFSYEQHQRAAQTRQPVQYEALSAIYQEWVEVRIFPGESGLSVYFRPIADRKRAEEELRQSRDQLEIILQGVADAVAVQDTQGRILYANLAAARDSGYPSVQAMLDTPPNAVVQKFGLFAEDGAPFPISQLPGRLALQGNLNPPEALMRVRSRETGEERWRIVRARPILDQQGKVRFAVNIWHDVAERMRRQQAERFLTQATDVLLSSLDYETTLTQVAQLAVPRIADWCAVHIVKQDDVRSRPEVVERLGAMLTSDGALQSLTVAHVDPSKVELARQIQERYPLDPNAPRGVPYVIRTGEPELVREINYDQVPTGAVDPEHLQLIRNLGMRSLMIVPLRARDQVLGSITMVAGESGRLFDETDLELAQELARRAALAVDNARLYQEAKEAVQLREQFLSIASHELRTPVTGLYGNIQLLQRLLENSTPITTDAGEQDAAHVVIDRARMERNLNRLDRQSRRLATLISELLDVSRLQKGTFAISPARMNLPELLGSVVEAARFQQEFASNSTTLELHLPAQPVWGNWDAPRLEQVFVNLLDNATKYSPGGGSIEISLAMEALPVEQENERAAHIVVRDHGIGIPPEQQSQLFVPFFRGAKAAGQHSAELGLGLAICKGIVEAHGGSIWVESDGRERGSAFHILLPHVLEEETV